MSFKDHFSAQAADYAKFRPRYPDELFSFLASVAPPRQLAWDCATGNGQAAVALARHFAKVIATDASAQQLAEATPNPRIEYRVAAAEESGLATASADLVTVAQALHWFDLAAFQAEAKRVLKPGGILAVWGYQRLETGPGIDRIVDRYYEEIVGPYWPPERRIIERGYADLPFPFEEIAAPKFEMSVSWSLDELLGYLRSWSATQRFMATNQSDPLALIIPDLTAAWGDSGVRRVVRWPLTFRAGRNR